MTHCNLRLLFLMDACYCFAAFLAKLPNLFKVVGCAILKALHQSAPVRPPTKSSTSRPATQKDLTTKSKTTQKQALKIICSFFLAHLLRMRLRARKGNIWQEDNRSCDNLAKAFRRGPTCTFVGPCVKRSLCLLAMPPILRRGRGCGCSKEAHIAGTKCLRFRTPPKR